MAGCAADTGRVDEIIYEGTLRMQQIARETLREVRRAMGLDRTMVRVRRAVERRQKAHPRPLD